MSFAKRTQAIRPFHVMRLLDQAQQLEQAGKNIIHLEVGEPDFTTAPLIIEAAQQALAQGKTRYTPATGIGELKQCLANWYQQRYQLAINPNRFIITNGASGGLLLLFALLLEENQRIMLADPGYPCNRHFAELVNAHSQLIPVSASTQYQLNAALVEKNWLPNTKAVLLANPSNPTGTIINNSDLAAICQSISQKQGELIADEIYHGLHYEQPCPSALQYNNEAYVVNSFSKYFGMTGWRLGWIVAPEKAIETIETLAQNFFLAPPTLSQYAAIAAFTPQSQQLFEQQRLILKERRDYLLQSLPKLGLKIHCQPQGAFYIYLDISLFNISSDEFCEQLLVQQGVALTPGDDFGFNQPERYVRIAYAADISKLRDAVDRIGRFIESLP